MPLSPLAEVFVHMSLTAAEHDLEAVTPGLARSNPAPLIAQLRALAAESRQRTGRALRQLGRRLPELSPLFHDETLAAVREALDAALADSTQLEDADQFWVHNHLVEAINPHLDAEAQLGMLLSLPTEKALSLNLLRGAKRLSAETFERLLDSDDGQVRRRVLFFAMANRTPLTPRSRARVFQAIQEDAEDA